MPSSDATDPAASSRRRLLAAAGTGLAGALAGCSSTLPGTSPDRLATEVTRDRDGRPTIVWRYPPTDGPADGIGYAAVELGRPVRRDGRPTGLRLTFNSTVGDIAASESHRGFRQDRFRFRLRPPRDYDGRLAHAVRVEPPDGQWDDFTVAYDITAGVRETVIELRSIHSQGTIQVDAVFDAGGQPLPDRLHVAFTAQAARPGVIIDETVRASDDGWLEVPEY